VAAPLLVPVVVDAVSPFAHFTTELVLTNRTSSPLTVQLGYTAASGVGSGTVPTTLGAGEQRVISDVLEALRQAGLPIPPCSQGAQVGTVRVSVPTPAGSRRPMLAASQLLGVTARTLNATAAPHPAGTAGVAYSALAEADCARDSVIVYGLRTSYSDRSNLAILNTSDQPVTLRLTAHSGAFNGGVAVINEGHALGPYEWYQYSRVLEGTGIDNGWVTVERVGGSGTFSAYGVINDNQTSDGSFVPPVLAGASGRQITVPVLVETPQFRSELVLTNRSDVTIAVKLTYVESLAPQLGEGGTIYLYLSAHEQKILSNAIGELRRFGLAIGPAGAASYAGALLADIGTAALANVYVGARTAAQSPGGGQFGLFTPGVHSGQEASDRAYVFGLRADADNRSNVALLNTGGSQAGPVTLQVEVLDGANGLPAGSPETVTLQPGRWTQLGGLLGNKGVSNGWVRVTRTSGSAPWVVYGVVNDGGQPGQRTGDGAYIPMTVDR
jgi:hypothetical protein